MTNLKPPFLVDQIFVSVNNLKGKKGKKDPASHTRLLRFFSFSEPIFDRHPSVTVGKEVN